MAYRIINGDALDVLRTLPDASVQCCVTSPPYWGLRDYGNAAQIGLERTPEEYVERLVGVFQEVRRVLAKDGTLWLNLGDSYATGGNGGGGSFMDMRGGNGNPAAGAWAHRKDKRGWRSPATGLKHKDLVGIPWMVAFALRADGWYLRSEIIWNKCNPMPESVVDRPTKAHEQVFLFSQAQRYYYDAAAIREVSITSDPRIPSTSMGAKILDGRSQWHSLERRNGGDFAARNRRSVWTFATEPMDGAHFAVMPRALVEPCILAGSRQGDTILDPFAGSGTVGVVARKHRRAFIGIELNADYCHMARGRLGEDLTAEATPAEMPLFHMDGR